MSQRTHDASRADRPRRGDELTLEIDRLAAGGRGVGRMGGYVVFVPLTAPGDRARVRVTRAKRRFAEAELVEVLSPSPDRVSPPCPHFGRCGGCSWQHLSYEAQLAAKAELVKDSFERLGRLGALPYRPPIPAPAPLHYRNKMDLAFHPEAVLGLHERGHFDRVLPIDACLLPGEAATDVIAIARAFALESGLSRYDPRTHEGFLRHLVYREARSTGEIMVGLVTGPGDLPGGEALARRLVEAQPRIASVVWATTSSRSDAVTVERLTVLHGRDHVFETLGGVRFAIGLETFFQTNSAAAENLARVVEELAEPSSGQTMIDLYCGVGAFALLFAPKVSRVFGIEVVPASIDAARENATAAGIENVAFTAGDARHTLPVVLEASGTPDLFVLDPPRSGAGGKVMRRIGRSRARRVVYVSCNPTTLAPDLAWLVPYGYEIRAVQPVDLFPQTYHVETVVVLDLVREPDEGVR